MLQHAFKTVNYKNKQEIHQIMQPTTQPDMRNCKTMNATVPKTMDSFYSTNLATALRLITTTLQQVVKWVSQW
jgi:hypothetical protein